MTTIKEHRRLLRHSSDKPDAKVVLYRELYNRMVHQDDHLVFSLLFVVLNPQYLKPDSESSVNLSRLPTLEMEWDHQGIFKRLSEGEIFYEGGETKSVATGTSVLKFIDS